MEDSEESLKERSCDIEDDIWDYIMGYIVKAEKQKDFSGRGKKRFVQENIRNLIGEEKYNIYSPFISVSIDFVISLSKNKKILKGININSFINCWKHSCII